MSDEKNFQVTTKNEMENAKKKKGRQVVIAGQQQLQSFFS